MEPKEFDFEFPRGDTCPVSFELTDSAGNALNMDSAEIYFTMKKNYKTQEYILQKRYSAGEITVEDTTASFVLGHYDTGNLDFGSYVYDIQFVSGDLVSTLIKGEINLTDEATWIDNETIIDTEDTADEENSNEENSEEITDSNEEVG